METLRYVPFLLGFELAQLSGTQLVCLDTFRFAFGRFFK